MTCPRCNATIRHPSDATVCECRWRGCVLCYPTHSLTHMSSLHCAPDWAVPQSIAAALLLGLWFALLVTIFQP